MLRKSLAIASVIAGFSSAAHAETAWSFVNNLSLVIVSEKACGLKYDQSAIAAFIEKNVPKDDMTFASNLKLASGSNSRDVGTMGESEKTAHCTQIKRVAKTYGFIKE